MRGASGTAVLRIRTLFVEMDNEYMKRGYLLPEGCKDLIDALRPKVEPRAVAPADRSSDLPPITRELAVPDEMNIIELAAAAERKPFQIIADLMEFGIYANVKAQLDFETISRVLRKYGILARRST
jgi:hypothetical protein